MGALNFIPLDWREWRRSRAVLLKQQGWYQRDIGEALGVSEETVSRWLVRARDGGPAALRTRPRSGRPPKLSAPEKRLIPEFHPRVPLARAGGLRLPRPGLDLCPRRPGHRGGVRCPLPSGPCRKAAQRLSVLLWIDDGRTREEVAQLVGVSTRQIGQWLRIFRNQGLEQLCTLHYKGDPGRLRPAQIQQLKHQIAQGGCHNTEQVRTWIDQTFGIRIHGQRP